MLNYVSEGGVGGLFVCFGFVLSLMEQSSNKLVIDKGEIPHSSCFNVLLGNSSLSCTLAKSKKCNSTDQHESAILLHVPSCDSTNDSLVYVSSELILLKINLTNHMVNS